MIIDFHTHILSPQIQRNRDKYIDTDSCFAILYSSPKAKLATADELITSMDETGIDISVVANYGWDTHELCVETNDYILESVARYPERLIGFCTVDLRSGKAAIAEIERCVKGGMKGVGEIRPDMQITDLLDEVVMTPFIDILREYKLILLVHASEPVGHQYAGKGKVTPEILYPFITKYPDLTIVCAHWGGGLPFYSLMPEVEKALNNVYFDTAATPFLYNPQIYNHVSQIVGADKILFGTDYPLLSQTRLLKEIDSLNMETVTREKILSGNACRILGLGK